MYRNIYGSGRTLRCGGFEFTAHSEGEWGELDPCGDTPAIYTTSVSVEVNRNGDPVGWFESIFVAYAADGFDVDAMDAVLVDTEGCEMTSCALSNMALHQVLLNAVKSLTTSIEPQVKEFFNDVMTSEG